MSYPSCTNQLKGLTVKQLKDFARNHQVKLIASKKDEICKEIIKSLEQPQTSMHTPTRTFKNKAPKNTCDRYKSRSCLGKGKKGTVWSVIDLKDILKKLKLSTTGNKAVLCARLNKACQTAGVPPIAAPKLSSSSNVTSMKQVRPKFKNIYTLVKSLKPSLACHGNGLKIIPFLKKIAIREHLKDVCLFGGKIKNSQLLEAAIAINFRNNPLDTSAELLIPDDFENYVKKCQENIIVINFALLNVYKDSGHSNLIIIDKARKEFERFEPHGEMEVYNDKAVDFIARRRIGLYLLGYRYIAPLDYCPMIGPQRSIELPRRCTAGGFCAVWSTLYGHLRLLNPDYSRREIIDIMLKFNTNLLDKYQTYINKLIPDQYIDSLNFMSPPDEDST